MSHIETLRRTREPDGDDRPVAPLLEVKDLATHVFTRRGVVRSVDGVSFSVDRGKRLCIVGESGSGKSMTAKSIMRLLPSEARIVRGSVKLDGEELVGSSERRMRSVRGRRISMLFQDPMTSLNPVLPIGVQIVETIRAHRDVSKEEATKRAVALLDEVKVSNARNRLGDFPHQYSGGMRQRVMLAIALSCDPDLIIADEPTTALDVAVQARVLKLLEDLRDSRGLSLILITHDMRIVEEVADDVVVMYAGQVVEQAESRALFTTPEHPYTEALLGALPRLDDPDARTGRLASIPGGPPDLTQELSGCRFAPRCRYAGDGCESHPVELREVGPRHFARTDHPASQRRDTDV